MNESERIRSLEERLDDVEKLLDKICNNSDVCGYKGERGHEESTGEKLKKYLGG